MSFIRNFFSGAPAQPSRQEIDLESQSLVSSSPVDYGSVAHFNEVEIAQQPSSSAPSSTRTPAYHYQIPHRNASIALARTTSVSAASAIAASGTFNSHVVTAAPTSLERARATLNESAHQAVQQAKDVHEYLNDREAEKMIAPYRAINVGDLDGFNEQLWSSSPAFAASATNAPLVFNSQSEVIPLAPPLHDLTPAENQEIRVHFREALVAFFGENLVDQYEASQAAKTDVAEQSARLIVSNDPLTVGTASFILMGLNEKAELLLAENISPLPPACRVMKREREQRTAGTVFFPPEVARIKKIVEEAEQGLHSFRNPIQILASKKDLQQRATHLYSNSSLTEVTIFNLDAGANLRATQETPSAAVNQQARGRFREACSNFYGEVLTNELLGKLETGISESTEPLTLREVSKKLSRGDQAIKEIKSFFEKYPALPVSLDAIIGGEAITLGKKEAESDSVALAAARRDYEILDTPAQNFIDMASNTAELVARSGGVVGGVVAATAFGALAGMIVGDVVSYFGLCFVERGAWMALEGAVGGLAIGLLGGAIIGFCDGAPSDDFDYENAGFSGTQRPSRSVYMLLGAGAGGAAGTVVGAVGGAIVGTTVGFFESARHTLHEGNNALPPDAVMIGMKIGAALGAGIGAVLGSVGSFNYFRPDLAVNRISAAVARFGNAREAQLTFFATHHRALESVDAAIKKVEDVKNRLSENDVSRMIFEQEKQVLVAQRELLVRQGSL